MTRRRLCFLAFTATWLVLLAVVAKRSLDRLPVPTWGNPTGSVSSLEVTAGTRVGQVFVAPLPGLYRIDIELEEVAAGSSGPIAFHLKTDPAAEQDIWATNLSGEELQPGRTFTLDFPVVPESDGQSFYFYVEAPAGASGPAVALGYVPGGALDGARALVNDQPVPGTLQFKTFYSLRTRDRVGLILRRMAEGRPYMFGSEAFYVGLGLAYVLVLGILLGKVAGAILGEQKGGP